MLEGTICGASIGGIVFMGICAFCFFLGNNEGKKKGKQEAIDYCSGALTGIDKLIEKAKKTNNTSDINPLYKARACVEKEIQSASVFV